MIDTVAAALEAHPPLGVVTFGTLTLDRDRRLVSRDGGETLRINARSADARTMVCMSAGVPPTRTAVFEALYWNRGEAGEPDPDIVTVYACKLRKRLKGLGYAVQCIWGVGYELKEIAE